MIVKVSNPEHRETGEWLSKYAQGNRWGLTWRNDTTTSPSLSSTTLSRHGMEPNFNWHCRSKVCSKVPFEEATYCSHRKVYRPTRDTFHSPLSLWPIFFSPLFRRMHCSTWVPQMRMKAATSYCCILVLYSLHAWLIDGHKQFRDADPTATDLRINLLSFFFRKKPATQ